MGFRWDKRYRYRKQPGKYLWVLLDDGIEGEAGAPLLHCLLTCDSHDHRRGKESRRGGCAAPRSLGLDGGAGHARSR